MALSNEIYHKTAARAPAATGENVRPWRLVERDEPTGTPAPVAGVHDPGKRQR
jgi:hypothetical protein